MSQSEQTPATSDDLHTTYTNDDEVRVEDEPALENASAAKGTQVDVNTVLQEAQVVGGSDNTSIPAGANGDEVGDKGQMDRVVNSEAAKSGYADETAADTGITAT